MFAHSSRILQHRNLAIHSEIFKYLDRILNKQLTELRKKGFPLFGRDPRTQTNIKVSVVKLPVIYLL